MRFLNYGRQCIEDDDIAAVAATLKGDYLTQGPAVQAFAEALKRDLGVPYAIPCSSGTAALHMAALAVNLGPGDVAIVPAITFAATANAVRYTGADVVFADCNPQTGLMELSHVEEALKRLPAGKKAKAVFSVHMNGQCTDMPSLYAFCKNLNIFLIEDACHALGTTTNDGALIGSCTHSDIACFSFHPVKTIAMGEGGAVTTRNAALNKTMELLVTHGITKNPADYFDAAQKQEGGLANPWYHEMQILGYNYRASDIHCALGLSQWKKLPRFTKERKRLATQYDKLLAPLAPVLKPLTKTSSCKPVLHLYAILVDFKALGLSRAAMMNELKAKNIGTQVHYLPVYRHPYYKKLYNLAPLPGAEAYYNAVLSIPFYVGLQDDDLRYVADHLATLLNRSRHDSKAAQQG